MIIAAILIVGSIATTERFVEKATDPATIVVPSPDLPVVGENGTGADTSALEGSQRKVYRHSVIPGGVYSARELAAALDTDAVAKDHYKTVALDRVQVKTVDTPRQVYVSYRVGDQVYWTKDKVALAVGESILSDGNVEIRARCGNSVSTLANGATLDDEPPPPELDEVLDTEGFDTGGFDPEEAIALLFPGLEQGPFADASNPEPVAPTDLATGARFFPVPFMRGGVAAQGGGASSSSTPASTDLPEYTGDGLLPILSPPLPPVSDGIGYGEAGGDGKGDQSGSGGDDHHHPGNGGPGGGGDDRDSDHPPTGLPVAVPEPGTILLVAVGAMSALAYPRRRRSRA